MSETADIRFMQHDFRLLEKAAAHTAYRPQIDYYVKELENRNTPYSTATLAMEEVVGFAHLISSHAQTPRSAGRKRFYSVEGRRSHARERGQAQAVLHGHRAR